MEKRRFGNTDMDVSVLGFGGSEIGFEGASQDNVTALLNGALDAGLNVIDTAECYVDSEELIGNAVAGRRNQFYLFTKCGHGDTYDSPAWGKDQITASVERSLRRLKTDYLDLLQLHSCSEEILRQGEVVEALQQAKREGKTRYIGYSGDGQAASYALGLDVFDSLQTSLSIADQEAIDLLMPIAREKNVGVITKRPVANTAWRHKTNPQGYSEVYWERLQKLKYDFINGDLDASVAHALRFTLSIPGVHTAIVGTSKPQRWQQNARSLSSGMLPQNEIDRIRNRWKEVAASDWVGQV